VNPATGAAENLWSAGSGSREAPLMGPITWGPEVAEVYDKTYSAMFEPAVLDPMVGLLAELAGGGPALEFAVGTGRVAHIRHGASGIRPVRVPAGIMKV